MENHKFVIKKAMINTLKASGGNIKTDSASGPFPGQCIVVEDNSVTPPVELFPPIPKGACVSAYKQASQAEVAQIAIIGRAAEVIVANTRYRVEIDNYFTLEGQKREPMKYAVTSAAVLTGTAATDRLNVYTALKNKINAYTGNNVAAYLMHKIAFTTGSVAKPVIGETITQATSNATAKIAAVEVTSGNFTATTAAGFLYVYDLSGTWNATSKVSTATSGALFTTAAALTEGHGLVIVDDGNYHAPRPNSMRTKSWIGATQGFETAVVETNVDTLAVGTTGELAGRLAVYAIGIGSRMLKDVPVFTPDGQMIVSGEAWMQTIGGPPDASKTYTTVFLEVNRGASDNVLIGNPMGATYLHVLWLDESNSTNLTNLLTPLASGLGVTIN